MTGQIKHSSPNSKYRFRLFIAGMNPASIRAIENIRAVCDSFLSGHYDLEVIDIYQQRHLAREMNLIAVPTLIRLSPVPERRMVGDMRDIKKLKEVMEVNGVGKSDDNGQV